jgi:hypothetical protein
MATKVRSFRLSDDVMDKLSELVHIYQEEWEKSSDLPYKYTPAVVLEILVKKEYDRYKKQGRTM